MMKMYFGLGLSNGNKVMVGETGTSVPAGSARALNINDSRKVYDHSTEFAWGYGGSGPAQTALAILLDHTKNPERAQQLHQDFKSDFVANWDNGWRINENEINEWLKGKNQEITAAKRPAPLGQKFTRTNIQG